jgi:hypothetical protein
MVPALKEVAKSDPADGRDHSFWIREYAIRAIAAIQSRTGQPERVVTALKCQLAQHPDYAQILYYAYDRCLRSICDPFSGLRRPSMSFCAIRCPACC